MESSHVNIRAIFLQTDSPNNCINSPTLRVDSHASLF